MLPENGISPTINHSQKFEATEFPSYTSMGPPARPGDIVSRPARRLRTGITGMDSVRPPEVRQAASAQFVGFEIAGQKYLFRIERIQEIITSGSVTRVPDVPAYVVGVSNLRGTIIPVIDLRLLFGLPARESDANTRTIVVNVGSRTMGCMVDAVSQVIRIPVDQIHSAPDSVVADGQRSVEGFARAGDDLFILLDATSLLDPAGLAGVHRAGVPGVTPSDKAS